MLPCRIVRLSVDDEPLPLPRHNYPGAIVARNRILDLLADGSVKCTKEILSRIPAHRGVLTSALGELVRMGEIVNHGKRGHVAKYQRVNK